MVSIIKELAMSIIKELASSSYNASDRYHRHVQHVQHPKYHDGTIAYMLSKRLGWH